MKYDTLIHTEINSKIFKALRSLASEYLSDKFTGTSESRLRTLRNNITDLQLPSKSTNIDQRYLSYRGGKPRKKQASSLQAFEVKLN